MHDRVRGTVDKVVGVAVRVKSTFNVYGLNVNFSKGKAEAIVEFKGLG